MAREGAEGSLLAETRRLIQASPKSLPELYKETGISFYWLRKFRAGVIPDPSVNRVQKLWEHLAGKELLPEAATAE